jgi:hypothetical protein
VEWYVVDTSSGELLAHVEDAENSCFRQGAHLDPTGQRIYCVVDPAITGVDEPESVQVAAYRVFLHIPQNSILVMTPDQMKGYTFGTSDFVSA